MTPADTPTLKMPHTPLLDGIRASAVSIVLLAHVGLEAVVPGGFGVTLFFFLSGFLITSLLRVEVANTGTVDIRGFYLRRVLRIIPPLWITMAINAVVVQMGWVNAPLTPWGVLADLLFLSNYANLYSPMGGFFGIPLWSLAVEEHFYLLFPFVVGWALPRYGARRLAAACAVVCVGVLGVRLVNVHLLHFVEPNYTLTHTRIDSILYGAILALWQNPLFASLGQGKVWRPGPVWVMAGLGLLAATLVVRDAGLRQTLRYSVQGVALFILVSYALQTRIPLVTAALTSRAARLIAAYSYSIYLVHRIPLLAWYGDMPTRLHPVSALVIVAITLAYAAAMFRWVERPLARIRHAMNRRNEGEPESG